MKSLQKIGKAATASRGFQFLQRTALGGVLLASLFVSVDAYGQGQYYPVTNPGGPYGATYTGVTLNSNPNLQALQISLQTLYNATTLPPASLLPTLQTPIPTGYRPATITEYQAAVAATIQGYLATPGNFQITVSLTSLANEAVAWRYASVPGDLAATVSSISQTIIKYDVANVNSAAALSDLNNVVNSLAVAQPTLIDTIMPTILNNAAGVGQTVANNWGANTTTAMGVGMLVATAMGEIPRDTARIATIVNAAETAITSSPSSLLPAFDPAHPAVTSKETAFIGPTGLVQSALTAPAVYNNVQVIQKILSTVTTAYGFFLAPANGGLSPLDQILSAAVTALNTAATNNSATVTAQQMGGLTEGALISAGGSNAAAIATRLDNIAGGTASYTDAVVKGYSAVHGITGATALAAYKLAVTNSPGLADAIASGAVAANTMAVGDVVHWALTNETVNPTPPPGQETHSADIVAAVMGAYATTGTSIAVGAIDTTNHVPWGAATFGDIAWASGDAASLTSIGNNIQAIMTNAALANTPASISTVKSIVDEAIQGATAGNNTASFADIVYKAQTIAKNTAGLSDPLVRQAIDSITTAGIPTSTNNSYLAVVAAVAGDGGANRTTIENAAYAPGTGEMTKPLGPGGDVTAATDGSTLVGLIQGNFYQAFNITINALVASQTHGSPTNNTIADLYGAILVNPNAADAALALAIKQSSGIPDLTLTMQAEIALHVSTTTQDANLNMVDAVVEHIKMEALALPNGVINDMVDFIGHQIITNPLLTKDVVIAATIIDPDNVNYVAHAAAFNNPTGISTSVSSLFAYAQITSSTPYAVPTPGNPTGALVGAPLNLPAKTFPGAKGAIIDQPAVAASITAGLTTGILEANMSSDNTKAALVATIAQAISASLSENQINLVGPSAGSGRTFNNAGDTTKGFLQSNGTAYTFSGSTPNATPLTGFTTTPTVGVAGAITGYMAEVTTLNQTATQPTISLTTAAVLTAAVQNAKNYGLQIAQAAGQAFAWVAGAPGAGVQVSTTTGVPGAAVYDIANALFAQDSAFYSLLQLENAVSFGVFQANNGSIGAGALGLNATGVNPGSGTLTIKAQANNNSDFYIHRSAAGNPVTDIFNL